MHIASPRPAAGPPNARAAVSARGSRVTLPARPPASTTVRASSSQGPEGQRRPTRRRAPRLARLSASGDEDVEGCSLKNSESRLLACPVLAQELSKPAQPWEEPDPKNFANFFRAAAPYIEGHRSRTFVIAVGSEVVDNEHIFFRILEDVLILNGLGVRVVLVYGCSAIVNRALTEKGVEPHFVGGYRVTDSTAMQVAMEVAGMVRLEVEAKLSRGPSVSVVRRHTRDSNQFHFAPPVSVVSGNYTTAKRRGVISGVDFGYTGQVRFVQKVAITDQLKAGNIVVLSNIGFSAVGEDVASHAAIELGADKLICMAGEHIRELGLGEWMPLQDAEQKVLEITGASAFKPCPTTPDNSDNGQWAGQATAKSGEAMQSWSWDLDKWTGGASAIELVTCVAACKNGVKRAHLIDAEIDGGLLLELYSRDGAGTMISADFYEGIRPASPRDVEGIYGLLEPLVRKGIVVHRPPEQLLDEIANYTVVERDSKVLGCVMLKDVGINSSGFSCIELGAFCVEAAYRNGGRGDSLLDYVEQVARKQGFDLIILLTTQTADWFCCRGFLPAGTAHLTDMLPEARRKKVDPSRNSKCYTKRLLPIPGKGIAPAGKRIGF